MVTEELELDGVVYTVTELSMREVLPIMEDEPRNLAIEMMKVGVTVDGEPIGEAIMDYGFGKFQKLLTVSNRVNGITDEGND